MYSDECDRNGFRLIPLKNFGPASSLLNPNLRWRLRPSSECAPSPNRLSRVCLPFPTELPLPSLPCRSASPPLLPLRKVRSLTGAPRQREEKERTTRTATLESGFSRGSGLRPSCPASSLSSLLCRPLLRLGTLEGGRGGGARGARGPPVITPLVGWDSID